MNLARMVQEMADAQVEFVIVGGWSAILHGSSYTTRDLDVCFLRTRANVEKLVKVLAPFRPRLRDFPAGLPFVWDAITLQNGTLFTLTTELGSLDLLGEVLGIGDFAAVWAVSVPIEAFDRQIWTLDLAALIRSKKAAGREKDLAIVPELEGLLEAKEQGSE
jgi:hypothetical protein